MHPHRHRLRWRCSSWVKEKISFFCRFARFRGEGELPLLYSRGLLFTAASSAALLFQSLPSSSSSSCAYDSEADFDGFDFDEKKSVPYGRLASELYAQGVSSNGVKVGVCSAQNMRRYQEDRWLVLVGKRPKTGKEIALVAVFDGHGGSSCAHFTMKNFPATLKGHMLSSPQSAAPAAETLATKQQLLERTLLDLDRMFIHDQRKKSGVPLSAVNSINHGGSTAAVVMLDIDGGGGEIVTSNVGDSRAIIVDSRNSSAVPLSSDHSPNERPGEEIIKCVRRLPCLCLTLCCCCCPFVVSQHPHTPPPSPLLFKCAQTKLNASRASEGKSSLAP